MGANHHDIQDTRVVAKQAPDRVLRLLEAQEGVVRGVGFGVV